ncbi:hypothetical protein FSP39_012518 [Pinctada imbricata]|uniref:TIR domain-containing protein n=1 Tax=Pinctada imbricata TaxID=66713 RepID=A0AA89BXA3_PINIB|nr:hypothetical protein FSP39_012518 [Pinctada imbricata]
MEHSEEFDEILDGNRLFVRRWSQDLFWICFVIYQFMSVKATQSLTCSSNKRCECSSIKDNKLKADCSRRQLSEIPRFDHSVVDIDLSGNENLSKIPAINYLPSRLIRLDATLCNLQHIELGALQGLKNLYYLDISWNPELTLDVLSNITNDLIGSNIKTLKFNAIQCSEGAALKSKVQSKNPAAKLCYHKEQFIPGSDVAENIVNAVNCSRKTVCVLSEYFLASEWCIYEFKMANLEKIYKRGDQNSLIILMLGSINTDCVPADIMTYLNSRSYLEVPSNIDEFDVYWDHIISVVIDE